jgi:outer membrane protein, multidrug efflux system
MRARARARRLIELSALMMLTGCVQHDIRPADVPAVTLPAAWRTASPTSACIDKDWWSAFGDPVLTRLVETALAHNSDLGTAAARVREAQGNLRAVSADRWPMIDVNVAGGRSRSVDPFGQALVQTSGEPQIEASYEIDLFGRLADFDAAARDAYLRSGAARDTMRLSVASTVASSYIALLGLDAQLDVARATVTARSRTLQIARSRVVQGYSPRLELDQAEAEYQAALQIVPRQQLAIARVEDRLSVLLGDTPHSIERGRSLDQIPAIEVPAVLPSQLLARRPDVAEAELALAGADRSLAAARKDFLPRFNLSLSAGLSLSSVLAAPITIWSMGGSVLAPIFEGGRLEGQAEASAGRRDGAAFAYRSAVLSAFRDTDDALASVQRIDEQIVTAGAQQEARRGAFNRATRRYREGYSPFLEQLDAQRELLSSELAYVQARTDALDARIKLYNALGGGWVSADTPAIRESACSRPQ